MLEYISFVFFYLLYYEKDIWVGGELSSLFMTSLTHSQDNTCVSDRESSVSVYLEMQCRVFCA